MADGARGGVARGGVARGGRGSVVPDAPVRTYYDLPVIKPPVWTWEIPVYFFLGGLAGASSVLGVVAGLAGRPRLARRARLIAAAAVLPSPALLVSDLGRPERFLNMLRVLRPTSPMSVGSWLLAAYAPAAIGAAGLDVIGRLPRLKALAGAGAAVLGPGLTTYTAVLVADTAVPVWHEARGDLPAVFAASGTAAAGAAAVVADPDDGIARLVAVGGSVVELAAVKRMEHRLGELGAPYEEGESGRWSTAAAVCTAVGAGLIALGGRRGRGRRGRGRRDRGRWGRRLGGVLVLAGSAAERQAVFKAGPASARDPRATVGPQRRRLAAREGEAGQADG